MPLSNNIMRLVSALHTEMAAGSDTFAVRSWKHAHWILLQFRLRVSFYWTLTLTFASCFLFIPCVLCGQRPLGCTLSVLRFFLSTNTFVSLSILVYTCGTPTSFGSYPKRVTRPCRFLSSFNCHSDGINVAIEGKGGYEIKGHDSWPCQTVKFSSSGQGPVWNSKLNIVHIYLSESPINKSANMLPLKCEGHGIMRHN